MIQSFDFIFDFRPDAAPSCVSEPFARVYGKHIEGILKHPRTFFSCQVIKILVSSYIDQQLFQRRSRYAINCQQWRIRRHRFHDDCRSRYVNILIEFLFARFVKYLVPFILQCMEYHLGNIPFLYHGVTQCPQIHPRCNIRPKRCTTGDQGMTIIGILVCL